MHDSTVSSTSPAAHSPLAHVCGWLCRPWLGVLSRTLAAIFGGYALASATTLLMTLALPLPRSQAVLTGMLSGIVICACAALWAFAVRSALKAWVGIAGPAAVMFAAIALIQRSAS